MPVVPDTQRSRRGLFRGLPREVTILSSVSFTVALGYGIVAPSIPAFARQFGVSTTAAASVISAFALMRIVAALPAGRLVDAIGERRTMATGIAIVAVSSVLAGLSHSFGQLIVLRGIGGLGSAMFGVSAQTLLLRTVGAEQRGRASGLYSGGFLLGSISGPAIGGLVAAWSIRAPFFIYGGMLLVPAGIALTVLRDRPAGPEGEPAAGDQAIVDQVELAADRAGGSQVAAGQLPAARPARARRGGQPGRANRAGKGTFAEIGRVLRSRMYQAAALANLADGFAILGVRSAIVPLFVHYVLHRSPAWTGIGFGIVAALNGAMLLPAGWAADRIGRRPVLVGGCLISGTGMIVLAFAPGLGGFLAAMAVLGTGSGLLDVAPSAMIGDLLSQVRATRKPDQGQAEGSPGVNPGVNPEESPGRSPEGSADGGGGAVVASYQMAGDIGAVTGPVAVGFLVDSVSYDAAFLLAACILGIAAVVGLAAPESRRRPGSGQVRS
jgi:MFS transporter, DHA1 family, multidrug resistance protein